MSYEWKSSSDYYKYYSTSDGTYIIYQPPTTSTYSYVFGTFQDLQNEDYLYRLKEDKALLM